MGASTVGHSQGATILLSGGISRPLGRALWSAPEALLGTPSALVERPRCNFGVILASLAFAPVSAVQGRGCDVQSVHAGMFRRVSPNPARLTFETVFGHQHAQNRRQESSRGPQEGPERHRRAWMEHRIVPKPSPEDTQETRNGNSIYSRENGLGKENEEMSINRWEDIELQSAFFAPCMCHIKLPPSA